MERLDDVLGYENLKIYQNSNFFSFSLDSIILANYCNIRKKDRKIVDFCTGNAIVPIVIAKRTNAKIDAVEIQKSICSLAKKSIDYNKLNDQITVINEDIKEFSKKNNSKYDLVLCNPPYFKINENTKRNISKEKMLARHEVLVNLKDLCSCAKKVLKDGGNLVIVHRSDRLIEILENLRNNNLEPKNLKFIHETQNKESTLVLIEAQKQGKVGLKISKPLILYNLEGCETEEYQKLQKEVR